MLPKPPKDHFFHRSMDLNCLATLDGMFSDINFRWMDLLGYTREELLAKPFLELIHPDDIGSTLQALENLSISNSVIDFRNRYRKKNNEYVWLQWNAYPPDKGEEFIYATARVIDKLVMFERKLEQSNSILQSIAAAQSSYIQHGERKKWWDDVLSQILQISKSEYGFIGVVGEDSDGIYLKTKAITNIAWNAETRELYERNLAKGMIFRNMNTLFGRPIIENKLIISNDVAMDPRASGRPSGHPPLNSFAGIPIREDKKIVGLVGLANSPNGYSMDDIETLKPVIAFLETILRNIGLETLASQTSQQLEDVRKLQGKVLESSSSGFLVINKKGEVVLVNSQAESLMAISSLSLNNFGIVSRLKEIFSSNEVLLKLLEFVQNQNTNHLGPLELLTQNKINGEHFPVETFATWLGSDGMRFPLLLSLNDIRQRQALADSLMLNEKLEGKIKQLAETQKQNEILSELVEFLQTCTSLQEGLELVSRFIQRFNIENYEASFFIVSNSNPEVMNEVHPETSQIQEDRPVQDCWAHRSRRVYCSWQGGHLLRCNHTNYSQGVEYCIPLFSLDKLVAIFSLRLQTEQYSQKYYMSPEFLHLKKAKRAEYITISQSISGALSTIALRESLQKMALTDELTGLPNRRAFQNEGQRILSQNQRKEKPCVIAILDIDYFKRINDDFGHAEGDLVLKKFSSLMQRHSRSVDICGRVGGEEFAIVFQDCDKENGLLQLQNLLHTVRSNCTAGGRMVTFSAGFICSTDYPNNTSLNQFLKFADNALYQAKENGRNQIVNGVLPQ